MSLESKFDLYWRALNGPPLIAEFKFHPVRRWRFDRAFPAKKIAIEFEGGVWSGGRHTRGAGYVGDCEKYNAAALHGWRVFRFAGKLLTLDALEPIRDLCNKGEQL